MSQHEARLHYMLTVPGLYSFGSEDTEAIKWALHVWESILAERNEMHAASTKAYRYRNAVKEIAQKLLEIDP